MKIIQCDQGSAEWHAYRLGRATASRIADIVAKTKTGWGASRDNYAGELVAERLTGQRQEKFTTSAMEWGTEHEPKARELFEFMFDQSVEQVGLVQHPTIEMACASPDGLIGVEGLLEIKCPQIATHISTLRTGTIDNRYMCQMMWQMACTGRRYCDFVSYHPHLPAEMQLFLHRVERDDERIGELEMQVKLFLNVVAKTVGDLRAKYFLREAA